MHKKYSTFTFILKFCFAFITLSWNSGGTRDRSCATELLINCYLKLIKLMLEFIKKMYKHSIINTFHCHLSLRQHKFYHHILQDYDENDNNAFQLSQSIHQTLHSGSTWYWLQSFLHFLLCLDYSHLQHKTKHIFANIKMMIHISKVSIII